MPYIKPKEAKLQKKDGITSDILKDAGDEVHNILAQLLYSVRARGMSLKPGAMQ